MRILVTGVAGFIGMNLAKRLLNDGHIVFGMDNLNDYYDVNLKLARLSQFEGVRNFHFSKFSLEERSELENLFRKTKPEVVINLAAQAGVRYSLENPHSYISSNIIGFTNILEACRSHDIEHLIFASSSSVYGLNKKLPFDESQTVSHPLAIYGATKSANELLSHSYSHLYGMSATGLRFFTVYGPWGRPDMAFFKFANAILSGKPIQIFNHGNMIRDFTFIDDVVEAVVRLLQRPATASEKFQPDTPDSGISSAPWRVFNVGCGKPIQLMDCIAELERALGMEAEKQFVDLQKGDVIATSADSNRLYDWIGFKPQVNIQTGIKTFVSWYLGFYKKNKDACG